MKSLVFLLLCIGDFPAPTPTYRLVWAPGQIPELFSPLRFSIEKQQNGQWKSLSEIQAETNWGRVESGAFHFLPEMRAKYQGKIEFRIRDQGQTVILRDSIPYLQAIRIHPYTDSIKPVMGFYLPVEGQFSSQKVYPLDTSWVRVEASAGHWKGQTWYGDSSQLPAEVRFLVWYRFDPRIRADTVLPMRQYWEEREMQPIKSGGYR